MVQFFSSSLVALVALGSIAPTLALPTNTAHASDVCSPESFAVAIKGVTDYIQKNGIEGGSLETRALEARAKAGGKPNGSGIGGQIASGAASGAAGATANTFWEWIKGLFGGSDKDKPRGRDLATRASDNEIVENSKGPVASGDSVVAFEELIKAFGDQVYTTEPQTTNLEARARAGSKPSSGRGSGVGSAVAGAAASGAAGGTTNAFFEWLKGLFGDKTQPQGRDLIAHTSSVAQGAGNADDVIQTLTNLFACSAQADGGLSQLN